MADLSLVLAARSDQALTDGEAIGNVVDRERVRALLLIYGEAISPRGDS
jgi:hypothetical protein